LGNGDGTFKPVQSHGAGGGDSFVALVADVNGDGIPDVLVAAWCDTETCYPGWVDVLLGNGDGTLQAAQSYLSGGFLPSALAVADVNGDGKPDLLVTNWCVDLLTCQVGQNETGVVGVLLNNTNFIQSPTATTVASSLNPSVYGQAVTFTAQVTARSGTPTGTVTILDGATTVGTGTLTNGSVSITVSSLPVGANSMTAKYQGSAGFASSTSTPLTQTVTPATTGTALASSFNPAGTNQSVTYTATVTSQYGGVLTGSVVFSAGSQSLGTASLSGNIASLSTSFPAMGTYSITAKYAGDNNNSSSTSSALNQMR
jgi:Bacterial Ig-like domain (group 3)/FG-GAP-like repeat